MKGATKAMGAMNKSEMMSDSIDDVLDNDEAEDEIEDLTSQVIITFSPFQEVYLNICNYFESIKFWMKLVLMLHHRFVPSLSLNVIHLQWFFLSVVAILMLKVPCSYHLLLKEKLLERMLEVLR
ncbi:hypothetical protein BHM03_00059700, partial [Ensete ventricosum]